MGFFKNMAIRKITNKRLDALFKQSLKKMKSETDDFRGAQLVTVLQAIYNQNSTNTPWEKPESMNELNYWVLVNIIDGVSSELSGGNETLQDSEFRVITETVYKYLPAFTHFESSLIMSK
jgi:UDP-glucose 6-dehydrogenase